MVSKRFHLLLGVVIGIIGVLLLLYGLLSPTTVSAVVFIVLGFVATGAGAWSTFQSV